MATHLSDKVLTYKITKSPVNKSLKDIKQIQSWSTQNYWITIQREQSITLEIKFQEQTAQVSKVKLGLAFTPSITITFEHRNLQNKVDDEFQIKKQFYTGTNTEELTTYVKNQEEVIDVQEELRKNNFVYAEKKWNYVVIKVDACEDWDSVLGIGYLLFFTKQRPPQQLQTNSNTFLAKQIQSRKNPAYFTGSTLVPPQMQMYASTAQKQNREQTANNISNISNSFIGKQAPQQTKANNNQNSVNRNSLSPNLNQANKRKDLELYEGQPGARARQRSPITTDKPPYIQQTPVRETRQNTRAGETRPNAESEQATIDRVLKLSLDEYKQENALKQDYEQYEYQEILNLTNENPTFADNTKPIKQEDETGEQEEEFVVEPNKSHEMEVEEYPLRRFMTKNTVQKITLDEINNTYFDRYLAGKARPIDLYPYGVPYDKDNLPPLEARTLHQSHLFERDLTEVARNKIEKFRQKNQIQLYDDTELPKLLKNCEAVICGYDENETAASCKIAIELGATISKNVTHKTSIIFAPSKRGQAQDRAEQMKVQKCWVLKREYLDAIKADRQLLNPRFFVPS